MDQVRSIVVHSGPFGPDLVHIRTMVVMGRLLYL